MKKRFLKITPIVLLGITVLLSACSRLSDEPRNQMTQSGKTLIDNPSVPDGCSYNAILTDAEIEGLLNMREEEKVDRDVYLFFYDRYQVLIFKNIAESDQNHMDTILTLIEGYGLQDQAYEATGEFTEHFQQLYNNLIAKGTDLVEAYKVGVEIEEMDIADIEIYLSETEVPNIVQVYTFLLSGSENHLKAFESRL
jgi:hypothetical protein